MVVCCKTDFSFSLSLPFLRRIFSLITFSLSVLVYMSIIENVKNKIKKIKNMIRYPTALFSVGRHFDVVKILPNQQEGTETGKESI